MPSDKPALTPQQEMEVWQDFRFIMFQYMVEKLSLAEGLTDAILRDENRPLLDDNAQIKILLKRLVQMNTRERFRAMSSLLDLLEPLDNASQILSVPEWVTAVNKAFAHEGNDSSEDVANGDPANSVYEFSHVKLPGLSERESLGMVLKGCSLVSLDRLFTSTEISHSYRDKIKEEALKGGNSWRVKRAYGGVHLYIKYQHAAEICKVHSHGSAALIIVDWLEKQVKNPQDNQAVRRRLRLLEAVDTTKYVISFLGKTPVIGRLVLLRASDGHVHVASFMKSYVGLPLRIRDVREEHDCVPLEDLLHGQVTLDPHDLQRNALTILPTQEDS